MEFETDAYFHIGLSHLNGGQPCQDYALSGVHESAAFAVVTDGCSTGGHTDVGARILAFSTVSAIREHWTANRTVAQTGGVPLEIQVRQKVVMAGVRETLRLEQQDMLATCIYQYVTPDGGFVHLQGDGVIAYRDRDGHIDIHRYEWADNRPLYPAYAQDSFAGFIQDHGNDINAPRLIRTVCEYSAEGFEQSTEETLTLGEGIRGITVSFSPEQLKGLDAIAVFSDGVTQIKALNWNDAVVELLAFKTTQGAFAKRRMIRVIKDAQKNGRGPLDDIAYAVVRVILPEGGNQCDNH